MIGGRGADLDTPTARIVAIDPVTHRIRAAGPLPRPCPTWRQPPLGARILSPAAAAPDAGTVLELSPQRVRAGVARPAHRPRLDERHAHDGENVYAFDGASMLSPAARSALPRIYVPNSRSGTVDVIDPRTYKVVDHFAARRRFPSTSSRPTT